MSHIGKTMARLGPKTSSLGGVGGGRADLSPQDIAAALAYVPAGLGRELICHVWWPDAAALQATLLDQLLMEAQLCEWRRRADVMVTAQLQEAIAVMPRKDSTRDITMGADAARRASAMIDMARMQMWPRIGQTYQLVRDAVLVEVASGEVCRSCKGNRSTIEKGGKVAICKVCEGTGHRRVSDRQRAFSIKLKHESEYRRQWRPVYEWTLTHCTDALSKASVQFQKSVEGE